MVKQYRSTLDGVLPDPYQITTLQDSFETNRIQDLTLNYSGSGTCSVAQDYFIECTGLISFLDLQWHYTFTPEISRELLYEGAAYDFAPDTDFTLIYNFPDYLIYLTADPAPDLIEAGSLRWQRPHVVDFKTGILLRDSRVQVEFLPLVAR
jgi:hypothetical protein